jgi:hypothetical protein
MASISCLEDVHGHHGNGGIFGLIIGVVAESAEGKGH